MVPGSRYAGSALHSVLPRPTVGGECTSKPPDRVGISFCKRPRSGQPSPGYSALIPRRRPQSQVSERDVNHDPGRPSHYGSRSRPPLNTSCNRGRNPRANGPLAGAISHGTRLKRSERLARRGGRRRRHPLAGVRGSARTIRSADRTIKPADQLEVAERRDDLASLVEVEPPVGIHGEQQVVPRQVQDLVVDRLRRSSSMTPSPSSRSRFATP
jgi:hypothetical protein